MASLRLFAASLLAAGSLATVVDTARSAGVYVDDSAQMFKPETIAAVNARDVQLQARTGAAVTVVTVKTTGGVPVQTAASREAHKRAMKGALIYIARDDQRVSIEYDASTEKLFQPALQSSIEQTLQGTTRMGIRDDGLIAAVDAISAVIAGGASGGHGPALPAQAPQTPSSGPLGIGLLWWVVIAIVAIFIVRLLLRRSTGSR